MKAYNVTAVFEGQLQWSVVEGLWINEFPWYEKGEQEKTFVQMVHSEKAIYLKVRAWDKNIHCSYENYGDPVYLDSCFEWFFSPNRDRNYINLEVNANGIFYLAYGNEIVEDRQLVAYELAREVQIVHEHSKKDDAQCWTLKIRFPKTLIESIVGLPITYDHWHANFYRCGGNIDPQYATWNPINHPSPQYHLPNYFGDLTFA